MLSPVRLPALGPALVPLNWRARGGCLGSGLDERQHQQGLSEAQEVDHLSDAEQRGNDQGAAVSALQEGGGALIPQDLPGTVQESRVGVLVDATLQ